MAKEIERKFLVADFAHGPWHQVRGTLYRQGYLSTDPQRTVRVRLSDDQAFLTVKGLTKNASRDEYEYEVPLSDAEAMLELCLRPLIEKRRYVIPVGGINWEIDAFLNENRGLVVAEIELMDANQSFEKPEWLGREVTDDARYYNANLVKHPFATWKDQ